MLHIHNGDSTANTAKQSSLPGQRLLTIENGQHDGKGSKTDNIPKAKLEITDLGKSVLKGEADFVALNGIDLWLGGVHLSGERNLWRWDNRSEKIVLT